MNGAFPPLTAPRVIGYTGGGAQDRTPIYETEAQVAARVEATTKHTLERSEAWHYFQTDWRVGEAKFGPAFGTLVAEQQAINASSLDDLGTVIFTALAAAVGGASSWAGAGATAETATVTASEAGASETVFDASVFVDNPGGAMDMFGSVDAPLSAAAPATVTPLGEIIKTAAQTGSSVLGFARQVLGIKAATDQAKREQELLQGIDAPMFTAPNDIARRSASPSLGRDSTPSALTFALGGFLLLIAFVLLFRR